MPTFSGGWTAFVLRHYNGVIMGAIASQITGLTIVYSIVIQTQIKESIRAPRHWPLCGEFTGDRWIPRTNGQLRGKCFHLMTSSWDMGEKLHPTKHCIMASLIGNISALLTLYAGNSAVTGEFPHEGQWRGAFILNKRLSKQLNSRWFETPSHS